MSFRVYEVFGFFTEDNSTNALQHKKQCICPFMEQICDGGGNRYQSFLHLDFAKDSELISFFNGKNKDIPAGVCSLITTDKIWIVCPRRLFTLDRGGGFTSHEKFCENLLRRFAPTSIPCKCGVWSEIKIKYSENIGNDDEDEKVFDYTFDYIVCPTHPRMLVEIAERYKTNVRKLESALIDNGYTLASRSGRKYVEEYPDGNPLIIEVMTSSTSGGNKLKGTTIQNAFRKAVLGQSHEAPGINYRQVWARMVSQLIVKSQIGKMWGGQTIWILQDALTTYISNTTDLNLRKLISQALKEVNILSLRYANSTYSGIRLLEVDNLYAGNIPIIHGDTDFNKLLQAASVPPKSIIENKLLGKKPRTFISL